MYPQFVDINDDGFKDIITGTYYGYAWWILGTKDGFSEATPITDKSNTKIGLPESPDENLDIIASAVAVDWDRDGDLDLLMGGLIYGELHLRRNEGSPSNPIFSTENEPIKVIGSDSVVRMGEGIQSPTIVDWDGDSHLDVIVGCTNGGVYWFRNQTETGEFQLAPAQALITQKKDTPVKIGDSSKIGPNSACYVHVCDYDHDNNLDLLVSGTSSWQTPSPEKPSSAEEEGKIKELAELHKKLSKLTPDSLSDEEYDKAMATEEYQKLERRAEELYPQVAKFMSQLDDGNSVWLFRSNSAKTSK